MSNMLPYIFPFSTRWMNYIYDVNTNTIVKISKSLYDELSLSHTDEQIMKNNIAYQEFCLLKEKGFLSSNRVRVIEHPKTKHIEHASKYQLNSITLQVTQRCNLRCKYCAYSGIYENRSHGDYDMSIDTAIKAIDFLVEHSVDSERLIIAFYGGEPLLQFTLIKKCVEYTKKAIHGREVEFTITTNGTLLTTEILDFLDENNFLITISLDGDKESHDRNRRFAANDKGSFNVIIKNVNRLINGYPKLYKFMNFNVVMDTDNDFDEINSFYTGYNAINEIQNLRASFISDLYAKKDIQYRTAFAAAREYEIFKILLSRMGRLNQDKISLLVKDYYIHLYNQMYYDRDSTSGIPETAHPSGPCTCIQRLFIDVNGVFYPCERVSEESDVTKIGSLNTGFDIEKIINIINIGKLTSEECKDCWNFRFCGSCVNTADNHDCLSKEKKLSFCGKMKFDTKQLLLDFCMLTEMGCDMSADKETFGLIGIFNDGE